MIKFRIDYSNIKNANLALSMTVQKRLKNFENSVKF